ncbi:MAG: DUF1839 family protein [Bacteriovorax sp.]|nr:DUF1839 family protein [Bacteriovorax sp.]
MKKILNLDPNNYSRHLIHGPGRTWAETNCYTDVLIEQIHALGHEPIAALSFTLRADFEGDQWTFFKIPHSDLIDLYGLDIQELAVWRPIVVHIEELINRGSIPVLELDSFFLPDTAGTAYQIAHVKSSVSVNYIDVTNLKLGYFHNQGYHELNGQNFIDIFQLNKLVHERILPPYFEFIKREREVHLSKNDIFEVSRNLLKRNFALIPKNNPFIQFKERFVIDLEWLMKEEAEVFHAYSFATLRQFGSCFELSETYFRWLGSQTKSDIDYSGIAESFKNISDTAKTYQFQLARALARKKTLDLSALDSMMLSWEKGMSEINECLT